LFIRYDWLSRLSVRISIDLKGDEMTISQNSNRQRRSYVAPKVMRPEVSSPEGKPGLTAFEATPTGFPPGGPS
jgi:hypothetical protein